MTTPTIDVVIHDDQTADVLTPHGRVVKTLTVAGEGNLGEAVGDYVAEQARLFDTAVLVRTTRDGSDDTLLLVDADRQATPMVLTADGTAVPATDLRETGFVTETAEPVVDDVEALLEDIVDDATHNDATPNEVTETADFTVNDPAPTEPIPTEPIATDPIAPPPPPPPPARPQTPPRPRPATALTGPVQVPTGAATDVADAEQDYEPTTPRGQRPKPGGKRGVGPHVPRPSRTTPAPAPAGGWESGSRLGMVWQRHRRPILVLGAALLAVVVAAGLLFGGLFSSGDSQAPTDPVKAMETADPASDAVECPTRTEGATTTGRDPGNQTSGVNVIKAFDYAYYTWRSGTAARAMVSSDGKVAPAMQIQSAIDVLDQDLRYCLSITDRGKGVYGVELTEIPPIGEPRVINQKITTTEIGGKFWIAAIEKDTPKP
ncbi:hypothetical protein O4158_22100 [Gordonia amicalis]|uniref:hypothetical protein n=1 Tax=Gordonia amicalis TaxID=89053 RepID=UPI0022B3B4CB|nr:hypothetical protein [Gordonia amicalis]MCZ4581730.1 hypothetical protein [Gordonia amicalis]